MTLTLRCQHRREDKTRPESKTNPRSMEDDVILNHFPGMSLGQKGESGQSGITTTKGRMLLAYKGLKMIYKSENDDTGILLEGISSSRSWAGLKVSSPGQLTLRNGLTWLIFCGGQSGNGYYIFWAGYFETRSKHSKGTCGHSDHCNQSDSCAFDLHHVHPDLIACVGYYGLECSKVMFSGPFVDGMICLYANWCPDLP